MSEINPHCQCELAGFCKRHQMQKTARMVELCQGRAQTPDRGLKYWKAWEQGRAGATAPLDAQLDISFTPSKGCKSCGSVATAKPRELVGTTLKKLIADVLSVTGTSDCGCKELATQMDGWGISGCEQRRELIIDRMVANRAVLLRAIAGNSAIQSVLAWASATSLGDIALRRGAGWFLDAAIRQVKEDKAKQITAKKANRKHRKTECGRPYTGWRGEQDGPRLYLGPFESKVRHLTYHIWPTLARDSWQWNLQQLSRRWSLFNGLKIVGIATDGKTCKTDEVLSYCQTLGLEWDKVIRVANKPKLREVVTWVPMLSELSPARAGADEVVFSAHAKGVQYADQSFTRNWTDLMYQSCLDYWPLVENNLRDSLMTGSFRQFGLLGKWHNWAYSGTFFWWRLREIGQRKWQHVDQWFAGTESWPGKMCDPRETTCLFLNDNERMYDEERVYWDRVVWPEWKKFQEKMRYQYAPGGMGIR